MADTPLPHQSNKRSLRSHLFTAPAGLALLVFGLVFGLYSLTLAPGVVGGDAGEHQLAVPLLGIPHTTGYPLYVLAGKLWTVLLPLGSPAWRMNLFSALGGALAAALTTLVTYRLSRASSPPSLPRWPGALVAGLALSFGLTLWQWSTIAGVRSFNVFFFALLTLEALLWADQRRRGQTQAAARTLGWLALTVGLSLAHHRTTIFYLPGLIIWIWRHEPDLWRQPGRVLKLAGLSLAPLLLYLFIYLRGINTPPYTHEQITDLESFWFLVGSGDSTGLFLAIDPAYLPARLRFIWADLLRQLSWPGVLLAGLGGGWLLIRRPGPFLLKGSLVLLLLLFTLDFEVVNLNEAPTWYLMPAYFIFAAWLGLGLNALLRLAHRLYRFLRPPAAAPAPQPTLDPSGRTGYASLRVHLIGLLWMLIALTLLGYSLAWPNWQTQYRTAVAPLDDWRQLLRGVQAPRFVESSLPFVAPNSIIWGDWEQYTPFKYYQLINGLRPDVTARNPLDRWPEKVAAAHAAGQPIYLTRKPSDLIGTPYLTMVGPLIQVQTEPQFEPPAGITPLAANFENELELLGYRATVWPQTAAPGGSWAGPILQLMLYWRVPQPVAWDYALSLRLLDEQGQEIYKQDATHPVLSSYPTTLWRPAEVVGDYYELPLPPQAGPLRLHLLPYRTEGPGVWYNLQLNGANPPQEGILLGPFGE